MIPPQRDMFDIPAEVAYLNCAYISPLAHPVMEAITAGARLKMQPWHYTPDQFFSISEEFRQAAARMAGSATDDIAIVPSVSYAVATIMRSLPVGPGQTVVMLNGEFPSTWLGWRDAGADLRFVKRQGRSWTDALLAEIGENIAIVVTPQCHWSDGGLVDLERIAAACREYGAELVLDLTQSLGVLPFETKRVRPAFMVAACYKWLLGPYGIALFYVDERLHQSDPIERSWMNRAGAEDFARLTEYRAEYQPGARRFDVGEKANPPLLMGAAEALDMIDDWGVANIRDTLLARNAAMARALDLPDVAPPSHILALHYPPGEAKRIAADLAEQDIFTSVRGDLMRVSGHVWTSDDDAGRFVDAIRREPVQPLGDSG